MRICYTILNQFGENQSSFSRSKIFFRTISHCLTLYSEKSRRRSGRWNTVRINTRTPIGGYSDTEDVLPGEEDEIQGLGSCPRRGSSRVPPTYLLVCLEVPSLLSPSEDRLHPKSLTMYPRLSYYYCVSTRGGQRFVTPPKTMIGVKYHFFDSGSLQLV